jgi:hypothetical protein
MFEVLEMDEEESDLRQELSRVAGFPVKRVSTICDM